MDVMASSTWAVRGVDGTINLVRWPEGTPAVKAAREGLMTVEPMSVEYVEEGDSEGMVEKWTGRPGPSRAARTETTYAPSPPGLSPDGR